MKKHLNIRITGRVQFVGFRAFTQRTALQLGITGHVKNKADGSVFVEAEAEESELNTFIEYCRKGTRWSRVDKVEISEGNILGFDEFRIERE